MIPVHDAFSRVKQYLRTLEAESTPIEDAHARFLAETLVARYPIPSFTHSAMDGYAVRAKDLEEASVGAPTRLACIGESRAGGDAPAPLKADTTQRIYTGAPVPAGADAVVIQEDVNLADEHFPAFSKPALLGQHIRHAGEALKAEQVLLEQGQELNAGAILACANQGHRTLLTFRRPQVAILSTGDELRPLGETLRPGEIFDSNRYALAAAIRAAGATAVHLPVGPDRAQDLAAAIGEAIGSHDLLITCGGVSVGRYDCLSDALALANVREIFWKVRMKPGKPLRFGMHGHTPVLSLPGNPVSALVSFELFGRPIIRHMLGDPSPYRAQCDAKLDQPLRAPTTRTEFVRGSLRDTSQGMTFHPYPRQGSADFLALAQMNALAELPAGAGRIAQGRTVRVLDLRGPRRRLPPFPEPD